MRMLDISYTPPALLSFLARSSFKEAIRQDWIWSYHDSYLFIQFVHAAVERCEILDRFRISHLRSWTRITFFMGGDLIF